MKKIISLIFALSLCLSLLGCGSTSTDTAEATATETTAPEATLPAQPDEPEVETFVIGDTVSTDILEFTLDEAQLAIALSNVVDETYCSPKEYDAQVDAGNPFVCPKGHTYAAFTYKLTNLDRANYNGQLPLVSAEYKDEVSNLQFDGAEYIEETNQWEMTGNNPSSPYYGWYFVLEVGDGKTFRSFIDVPVEADSLDDEFALIVNLPTSNGSTTSFTYLITQG